MGLPGAPQTQLCVAAVIICNLFWSHHNLSSIVILALSTSHNQTELLSLSLLGLANSSPQ